MVFMTHHERKVFFYAGIAVVLVGAFLSWPVVYKHMQGISQDRIAVPLAVMYENASPETIRVTLPFPDAVVGKEFSVIGEARGNWFFEGSFPVLLLDTNGATLAEGIAQAEGEWMTTEFAAFRSDLRVKNQAYIGPATLILKKDNPSGEPERDASVSFQITIEY